MKADTDKPEPALPIAPRRTRFQGVRQIVQYNWPFYAGAVVSLGTGLTGLKRLPLPKPVKIVVRLGLSIAMFWTAASLLVSFWVYDRSPLYRWRWIAELFPETPREWVNIHSGLDETSLGLQSIFPATRNITLDIYNPREMTEPSIRRARAMTPPPVPAVPTDYSCLPLRDSGVDAVFLLFAAHELRQAAPREQFFRELHRVLRPGGRLVIVEHARDFANFLAFGPGFWHFLPVTEWLRLGQYHNFNLISHDRLTPFVHVFLMEKIG